MMWIRIYLKSGRPKRLHHSIWPLTITRCCVNTNLSRLHWLSVSLVAQSSSLSAEFLAVSSSMVAAALSNSFKCLSLSLMMSSFSSSKLSRCLCRATLAMRNFSISFSKLPIVSIREARVASKYLYWEQKIVTFNWWIQMTVLWCWKSYHCFIYFFLVMSGLIWLDK